MREQLIAGQLTRAEQAEEIVLLRNELAVTRKKLVKLESQDEVGKDTRGRSEAAVPEWAETNGHVTVMVGVQEPHVRGCGCGCGLMIKDSLLVSGCEGVVCQSSAQPCLRTPSVPTPKSGVHRKRPQSFRHLQRQFSLASRQSHDSKGGAGPGFQGEFVPGGGDSRHQQPGLGGPGGEEEEEEKVARMVQK